MLNNSPAGAIFIFDMSMIGQKKNFFFVRYFYRWTTTAVCIVFGIAMLLFYVRTFAPYCLYPRWFTVSLFAANILLLVASTAVIQSAASHRKRNRMHKVTMFILLILNPALCVGAARELYSILWAVSIAAFLLYCLLFAGFRRRDLFIIFVPLYTVLFHVIWCFLYDEGTAGFPYKLLFGFMMSLFYGLFYWFFKFCLDNSRESLSVYLENEEICRFLEGYELTPREREVCACLINGYSAGKIGETLFISTGTAKNHIKHIYRKIGISRRMELMHLVWDFTMISAGQQVQ